MVLRTGASLFIALPGNKGSKRVCEYATKAQASLRVCNEGSSEASLRVCADSLSRTFGARQCDKSCSHTQSMDIDDNLI